ncbi:MAG: cytochrome-c peroxidase [Flavobacteriales bacterium]|jgi:cytochrome c peroxidase|nr:cytochrome-c peroxidase [Flavobacteriales bacterium]MBT3964429.1 cytochrome-c peroxidase [Flavobacteriales bacterium]MBT5133273.1 cytochrome-c peroxidase [Flavobacteriales bacterium]MBT5976605.1 cytochrome-c peroxidase [Flavobacteriales bacterium]MBT6131842.1 cytochrome-c peroxidase [Flavobacteriales bacterium]
MRLELTFAIILVITGAGTSIIGCKNNVAEPEPNDLPVFNPTRVELEYPSWFPEMPLATTNPLTVEGIELGRKLYYDPLLHPQGTMSCSSCHQQDQAFTINTSGTAVLAHVNLGWSNTFLWEGGVEGTIEDIMLFEVEEFFKTDVSRIETKSEYQSMFYAAFGERDIDEELCAMALAQFFRTMISSNSRFDQYYPGDIQPNADELEGYYIFNSERGDCFHCHAPPLFTDNEFHNIGLDSTFDESNSGRFNVTGSELDRGAFKTPTLRNIELTAPYMHDGRFSTLEEVIEHYDNGVHSSNTLDPILTKAGKEEGLNLTDGEKASLIAFLISLTDPTFTSDSELSEP